MPDISPTREALKNHADSLAALVPSAVHPDGGFGWLDPTNHVAPERGVELWIHCRMTHVAALEVLRGNEGARPLLDVGYDALVGRLHDGVHGGWFATTADDTKAAYAHAFVILAATSLTAAGHPGGPALLAEAKACFDEHFWDEDAGMSVEQYDRSWSRRDDYRGVNANMHTVEAFLAVADVTGERRYLDRALRIVERVVHTIAREAHWRVPEHFDAAWQVLPDYNRDNPADPFRPYGVTIGHLLEWGRLTVDLRTALGVDAPEWMIPDAQALVDAALARGWAVDGADGFVYTTDYEDHPIVRERLHWVVCEAIAATWAMAQATDDARYLDWYERLWAYAREHLLDGEHGGWYHELSRANTPTDTIWWGKPDIYHAYQATITPLLSERVSFAGACARN